MPAWCLAAGQLHAVPQSSSKHLKWDARPGHDLMIGCIQKLKACQRYSCDQLIAGDSNHRGPKEKTRNLGDVAWQVEGVQNFLVLLRRASVVESVISYYRLTLGSLMPKQRVEAPVRLRRCFGRRHRGTVQLPTVFEFDQICTRNGSAMCNLEDNLPQPCRITWLNLRNV